MEKTARRLSGLTYHNSGSADTLSLSDEMVGLMEARNTDGVAASINHTQRETERRIIGCVGLT